MEYNTGGNNEVSSSSDLMVMLNSILHLLPLHADAREMFENARSFNIDLLKWSIYQCSNMNDMFYNATSYNQNLCKWGDSGFPYERAGGIFLKSGCTYTDMPSEKKGGPFCASNCST